MCVKGYDEDKVVLTWRLTFSSPVAASMAGLKASLSAWLATALALSKKARSAASTVLRSSRLREEKTARASSSHLPATPPAMEISL